MAPRGSTVMSSVARLFKESQQEALGSSVEWKAGSSQQRRRTGNRVPLTALPVAGPHPPARTRWGLAGSRGPQVSLESASGQE